MCCHTPRKASSDAYAGLTVHPPSLLPSLIPPPPSLLPSFPPCRARVAIDEIAGTLGPVESPPRISTHRCAPHLAVMTCEGSGGTEGNNAAGGRARGGRSEADKTRLLAGRRRGKFKGEGDKPPYNRDVEGALQGVLSTVAESRGLLVWEHAHIQRPILLKTWWPFHPTKFVLKFQLGNHMVFTNKISKEKWWGGTAGVFSNWLTFGSIPKGT